LNENSIKPNHKPDKHGARNPTKLRKHMICNGYVNKTRGWVRFGGLDPNRADAHP